jgi:hypothetical protein
VPLPASAGTQPTPPTAQSAHATGFTGPTPALRLAVRASAGQPPIHKLKIELPPGLRFVTHKAVRGVTVQGTPIHRTPLLHRELILTTLPPGGTFTQAGLGRTLRLSIGQGALEIEPGLARRLPADGRRHVVLRVVVHAATRVMGWRVVFTVHV